MQDHFKRTNGCEVLVTPGFNTGLNKTYYRDILLDTVFGLVPRGNSPETHRLAEVLLTGGIPVMLDEDANAPHMQSYPHRIPVLSGPTWDVVEKLMLSMENEEIDALQESVIAWWDQYWSCVHEDMRWILAQSRALSEGRNLCTSRSTWADISK